MKIVSQIDAFTISATRNIQYVSKKLACLTFFLKDIFDIYTNNIHHIVFSLYPLFSLEKKGILISYQSRSVVRLSVRLCVRASVRPCVCASVTFLVIVSPPKPLEVATSNFIGE